MTSAVIIRAIVSALTGRAEQKERFAALLRDVMAEKGMRPRELGRRLDPSNHSSGQRNVFRYLAAKTLPTAPMRDALEDALNVARGTLNVEEVALPGDTFRVSLADGASGRADDTCGGNGRGAGRGTDGSSPAGARASDLSGEPA